MPRDVLLYGAPPYEISMDGRLLAHLKIVIIAKLRRNEPFLLSWERSANEGSERTSLWMHPSIPLQFLFSNSHPPQLNTAWLEQMAQAATTNEGLRIMPEPPDPSAADGS